jgi:dihydrolipoamide dehydrogenase
MPWAIFSNPQVAGVGKTEEELITEWVEYFKWVNYYKNSAMWDALRSEHGMVKLLFSTQDQKLLWAHIVWPEASNMIHMLIVFINFNATLWDILKTVFIHPALPENIRNAARKAKINVK